MPETSGGGQRLAELMNSRRLDLNLRWDDVAERAGISAEALRLMRRTGSVPRELTQRAIEKALQWEKGSIRRIVEGGEPELTGAPALETASDAVVVVLTEALSVYERVIMDSDLPDDLKAYVIRTHRATASDELIRRIAEEIPKSSNG